MASAISTYTVLCPLSSSSSRFAIRSISCTISHSKILNFHLSPLISPMGRGVFSEWNGLKHMDTSSKPKSLHLVRKTKCKGKVVYASLFGVGAPEALVIGVVALLVFGPKGLAEVARNLGKTLREFQPTIKELQEVSREFKSTLEREIGLDEVSSTTPKANNSNVPKTTSTPTSTATVDNSQTTIDPNGTADPNRAYTSEEYLKIREEQLKASAAQQEVQAPPPEEGQLEPEIQPHASKETAATVPPSQKPESET
ncbi:hypothetical protein L6164_008377 [Bauhinia variegata]|uniref:Uncharacterized protein n=1 Tax=Bauhinia variegata TaxID=167791 RepID=A0ACB9PFP5_BAUVA|nr:hypothetical protein L6164_008377 [Bauhinia variegata]